MPSATHSRHRSVQPGVAQARSHSPIYDELVIGCRLITHRAHPRGLLLIHLQVEHSVKALQVCAGLCTAGHREPHLHQLESRERGVKTLLAHNDHPHGWGQMDSLGK